MDTCNLQAQDALVPVHYADAISAIGVRPNWPIADGYPGLAAIFLCLHSGTAVCSAVPRTKK